MSDVDETSQPLKRRKSIFRFGLRTFFIAITLFSVFLAINKIGAERQAQFVEVAKSLKGEVYYDFQLDADGGFDPKLRSPVPKMLLDLLGHDFFHDVVSLKLYHSKSDNILVAMGGGTTRAADLEFQFFSKKKNERVMALMKKIETLESLRFISLPPIRNIDSVFENHLSRLAKLERITVLKKSDLSDVGISHLKNLKNFSLISVVQSKITDESMKVFGQMKNLKTLYLAGHHFSDDGIQHLAGLENLRLLAVSGTPATKSQSLFGIFAKKDATNKMGNQVSSKSLQSLKSLKNLRLLAIGNTKVDQEFVKEFKSLNPGCTLAE